MNMASVRRSRSQNSVPGRPERPLAARGIGQLPVNKAGHFLLTIRRAEAYIHPLGAPSAYGAMARL